MDGPLSPAATLRHSSRLAGDRATGAVTPSRRPRTGERKGERRPSRGAWAPRSLPETVTLLRGGLLVVVQLGPIVVHLATVLAAVAIVRTEVAPIGPELAAVTVDVVLIVADVLPGAPQIGPVLLHRGHVARRPILLELLLVLAHGLVIAVTVLPVGAEILPVLADIALVTPELTAVLLHLRVGRQGRLPVHARRPGGHCERSEHCHCLPSAHVFLRDWDAVHLVRRGAADGRLPG